jgi:hypothetical protein
MGCTENSPEDADAFAMQLRHGLRLPLPKLTHDACGRKVFEAWQVLHLGPQGRIQ